MELDWSIQATLHAEGLIKLLLIFVKEAKKNLNRRFENPLLLMFMQKIDITKLFTVEDYKRIVKEVKDKDISIVVNNAGI
jgi:short-subunit dehydrogenase